MIGCVHCAHDVPSIDAACLWCGLWQNGHMPMCESHTTSPSIGLCVICARPVCGECAAPADGRLFCSEPSHRLLAADHRLVATFESEFEADWVKLRLERAGVPVSMFSFRDHVSAWWFPLAMPVRLFIPSSRADDARDALSDVDDLPHLL